MDHATHAFGLAVPSGLISTTGMGGLTLGGGSGYLTRRYGLTIDNLLEADIVLADGRLVTASAEHHPDLFWALRGGGGNFGVVTSFLFRAQPVHTVYAGLTVWSMDRATEILRWYREFLPAAPEDLYGFLGFKGVPAIALFPEQFYGMRVCAVVWCYTGRVEAGVDPDPAGRERIAAWTRAYWEALHPHSTGGAYVNFIMDEGQERIRATYRDNCDRLVEIKRQYDPDNLFRVNQNIRPDRGGDGGEE